MQITAVKAILKKKDQIVNELGDPHYLLFNCDKHDNATFHNSPTRCFKSL